MPGPSDPDWNWKEFWPGFWSAFGKWMAMLIGILLVGYLFADTSFATFESAVWGTLLWTVFALINGWDGGEKAVKQWRERQVS